MYASPHGSASRQSELIQIVVAVPYEQLDQLSQLVVTEATRIVFHGSSLALPARFGSFQRRLRGPPSA
jgi:hypothetical protein